MFSRSYAYTSATILIIHDHLRSDSDDVVIYKAHVEFFSEHLDDGQYLDHRHLWKSGQLVVALLNVRATSCGSAIQFCAATEF